MMKIALFVLVVLLLMQVTVVQASVILPENYFTITIIDNTTGKPLSDRAIILLEVKFNNTIIHQNIFGVQGGRGKFNIPLYSSNFPKGSEAILTAGSDDYDKDQFVYTIKEKDPKSNFLFDHTFYLNRIVFPSEIKSSSISIKEFIINVATTSDIINYTYDFQKRKMFFSLNESYRKGHLDVTFPKELMETSVIISVDSRIQFLQSYEVKQPLFSDEIYIEGIRYEKGIHEIAIEAVTNVGQNNIQMYILIILPIVGGIIVFLILRWKGKFHS